MEVIIKIPNYLIKFLDGLKHEWGLQITYILIERHLKEITEKIETKTRFKRSSS